MSEARISRDRQQSIKDQINRSPAPPPDGARSLLVMTTVDQSYPTTAGVFYAVFETDVTGPETEGAIPAFSAGTQFFFALNMGSGIPPQGTVVLAESQGGIWCFRYDS